MSEPAPSDPITPRWLLALFGLVAVVPPGAMAWWWSTFDTPELKAIQAAWLARLLYWWMPLTCVFASICLIWRLRARQLRFGGCWRVWWPGIALAILATVIVFAVSPPQMRVQFDETCLVGTSQNMHQQRLAVMTTGALPYQGQIIPVENMVDKRPTLFAFLVSLLHDVSGYRVANAFLVNGLLLALGLFLLFAAARARLGLLAGLSAPLLVLAVPLTYVVATSAGFELLATVLLVATTIAALAFVEQPGDARCAALLGVGALLVQARYESILACAILFGMAAIASFRRYRPGRWIWCLLAVCPTLVTPLFFLLQHAQDPNFTPEAGGQALVSLAHLRDHAAPCLSALFSFSPTQVLPGVVAVVAVCLWAWRVWRRAASRVDVFVVVAPIALTIMVLAWFYGDVNEVTALRLFLPIAWLLPLGWLAAFTSPRMARLQFVVIALMCGARMSFAVAGDAFPQLRIATLTHELDRLVTRLPGDRGTTLWVGAPAQHLIVKGHAAVSVKTFVQMRQDIAQLQRQGDVVQIYLIATPLDRDMEPVLGSPRELLRRVPNHVVERVGGDMPITVYEFDR
jgi:hypothetical protein